MYLAGSAGEVCVGTLPTWAHGVRGKLCIIDQSTMVIRDFDYDGRGPGQLLTLFVHTYIHTYIHTATVLHTKAKTTLPFSSVGVC